MARTTSRFAQHFFGVLALVSLAIGPAVQANGQVDFRVAGGSESLEGDLRDASLLLAGERDKGTSELDTFANARAEYARLLGALYARGHYSPVINVLVDGREAASIAPLDAPTTIARVVVIVDPGPQFRFSRAELAPLAPGTALSKEFATGRIAASGTIRDAVTAGVDGWRNIGHAKADVAGQDLAANHDNATLAASVKLRPGPRLRFGPLAIEGNLRMRENRVRKIAGLPVGAVFSPAELDRVENRLRRTGIFRSVTITEAEAISTPDLLGITATVVEEKTRRYSIGAEIASLDGVALTGFWLHRNLLGGGERFRIEGSVTNIGAQSSGVDYRLGVTIDRPATLTPDTTLSFATDVARLDDEDYRANLFSIGATFSHVFSNELSARLGITYDYAEGSDDAGDFRYRNLALPVGVVWDRRDNAANATKGFYLDAEAKPFVGFGTTESGARLTVDARAYRGFGENARVVLAGRLQAGAVYGSSLVGTPRDFLFYSGGGGTVRGQPYQSLGVFELENGGVPFKSGGTFFLASSVEARVKVTDKIGVVGFFDVGHVAAGGFGNASGDWHSGAGLGLRYDTGFGPIRLDVAAPVGGNTGDGVQIYIGLGQSF